MPLNDDISESLIARSIMLQRFTAFERRRILRLHAEIESDLRLQLIEIDPPNAKTPGRQKARMEKLLAQSSETVRAGYREIQQTAKAGLYQLAKDETAWFIDMAETKVGVNYLTTELSAPQLRAIASDTLIQGAPSKDWWGRQAGNLQYKFEGEVRKGMLLSEPTDKIVQRVRGTKAAAYRDGIMEGSRREAEALVRTSVQAVANKAREDLYVANQDIINGVVWLSTLDNRVTVQCMSLSGKSWSLPDYEPIGHDQPWPGAPPLHFNCRSTLVSVFKSFSELAGKKVKTKEGGKANAQAIFERNLRESGMSEEKIAKAVYQARSSMDGQVPKETTMEQFLSSRSKAVQDDMLGPGRADLWRSGKISLSEMIDQSARPLTLEELRKKA